MTRIYGAFRGFATVLLAAALAACGGSGDDASAADGGAAFVTRLGADTVAVERFSSDDAGVQAELLVRIPRTTVEVHELELGPDGLATRFERRVHDAAEGPESEVLERQVMTFDGDSVTVETTEDGETRRARVEGDGSMLPFLEMTHWPFELATQRAMESEGDSIGIGFLSGRGPIPFQVYREDENRWALSFFRGTIHAVTDGEGHVRSIDASETTRKLAARRVDEVPFEQMRRAFVEFDETEGPLGALSGRGEAAATVDGAHVTVDYGRPSKRGREIFGGLVPFGEVWRTGANRATHLTADRALVAGGTRIPAGTYTLWTVPGPDSWTLIVNEETEIGGTSYDSSHDLARLEMDVRPLEQTVENFTVEVDDTEDGGALRLRWDRTEAYLPFRIGG